MIMLERKKSMAKNLQRCIEVYAHWMDLSKPTLVGILYAIPSRGKEIFSFEYDLNWLNEKYSHALDPSLQLFQGQQYTQNGQQNFGIFLDSSPDRWGRFLMNRRESQRAREEGRKEQRLLESDYLLGVYDEHRMGALRFKIDSEGPFLDNNKMYAVPPWTALREIEYASLALEKKGAEENPKYTQWLKMLIAPGGSLGGARPKASVLDENQHPWIAKFPSRNDDNDVAAWEMVAYKLAICVKITMAKAKLVKFNSCYHTFLNKRFDRVADKRIHFASAMTLLQRSDGDDASNGTSYLELAQFIMQQGAQPMQDLEQLWRRIVFYICISNCDDHLRNHGFIFQPSSGWRLSPAFDINPNVDGDGLKLNISESDNSQTLTLAKEVAEYFRIKPDKANNIIKEIVETVKKWREVAKSLDISIREQDRMARAFRIVDHYT